MGFILINRTAFVLLNMLFRLYTFRVVFLIAVLLACVGLTPSLLRALEMNNSLEVWFLEDAPALKVYRDFQAHFGSDEVIIMIYHDEAGIITHQSLNRLAAVTAALDSLPDVANVYGLANVRLIERTPVGLRSSFLLDSLGPMEDRLATYPWLEEHFLNKDHTATRLLIQLKADSQLDTRRGQIIQEIRKVSETHLPRPSVALGGVGVIFEGLNEVSLTEFSKFLGLAYLVMFLLLIFLYRNAYIVILAIGVITLASYITQGFYGLAGLRLNMMSTLIPVILTLLGLIDVIHIVNERAHLAQASEDNLRKALTALKSVWRPCLFTTLTTMAGFLSLLLTPMPILRQFGLFSAIGVFLCLIFSYLLGVFFLPRVTQLKRFNLSTAGLWTALYRRRMGLGIAAGLLTVLSLAGLSKIKVDTYTLGYLPESHRVVQDHNQILEHWGDYMPLDFLIKVPDSTSVFQG
ncbi:MAG: MMPL family transporter, partial [Bacteroidota bacterium]